MHWQEREDQDVSVRFAVVFTVRLFSFISPSHSTSPSLTSLSVHLYHPIADLGSWHLRLFVLFVVLYSALSSCVLHRYGPLTTATSWPEQTTTNRCSPFWSACGPSVVILWPIVVHCHFVVVISHQWLYLPCTNNTRSDGIFIINFFCSTRQNKWCSLAFGLLAIINHRINCRMCTFNNFWGHLEITWWFGW